MAASETKQPHLSKQDLDKLVREPALAYPVVSSRAQHSGNDVGWWEASRSVCLGMALHVFAWRPAPAA